MKRNAFKKYSGRIDAVRKKKEFITFLVMVVVLFGGGVFLGYYIWGVDKQLKPDYKKYLKDTIIYLEKMEESNAILSADAKSLKTDVSVLKKAVAASENKLMAATKHLEEKLTLLEEENAGLKLLISEKDTAIAEAQTIKANFEELQNKFNILKEEAQRDMEVDMPAAEKTQAPPPVMNKETVVKPSDMTSPVVDEGTSKQENHDTAEETEPLQGNHKKIPNGDNSN